jgi:hypothetical protein
MRAAIDLVDGGNSYINIYREAGKEGWYGIDRTTPLCCGERKKKRRGKYIVFLRLPRITDPCFNYSHKTMK